MSAVTLVGAAVLPQAASASVLPSSVPAPAPTADAARSGPVLRAAGPLRLEKAVSPDPLTVGDTAVYTLVVTNTGDRTAHDVTVSDTLDAHLALNGRAPKGCTVSGSSLTCGGSGTDLAPGAELTYRIPVRVLADTTDGTNIVNEATVRSSDAQGDQARTITIARTLTNVVLTKTGPADVHADGTYTYTFTVTNEGPSDAVDVTVQDNTDSLHLDIEKLPAQCPPSGTTITCPLHTLEPGDTRTFTVTVHAHDDVPDGTVIENCADVYTGSRETWTADNHSCVTTTVDQGGSTPTPTPTHTMVTPTPTPTTVTPKPRPTRSPTPSDSSAPHPTSGPTSSDMPSVPAPSDGGRLAGTGTRLAGMLGAIALLLTATGVWLLRSGKAGKGRRH